MNFSDLRKRYALPKISKSDLYMEGKTVTPSNEAQINGSNFSSDVFDTTIDDEDMYFNPSVDADDDDDDDDISENFEYRTNDFYGILYESNLNDNVDELEEALDEIEEAINAEYTPTLPIQPQPDPETPERYLKDWFNRLCGNNDINKYIQNNDHYYFVDDANKEIYPQLYYTTEENCRCYLKYKDFTLDLTSEESLKLSRIFKKGFNDYYLSIFKNKVREIDRPERNVNRNGRSYGRGWL